MSVTYTNRKGVTYYLCRGLTKAGKPRYYFAREPRDEPVEQVPAGYKITESVNAVVSLARDVPGQILPEEVAAVEAAVRRHPRSGNYRVAVKRDRIEVCERTGPDVEALASIFRRAGVSGPGLTADLQAVSERDSRYKPELRFILVDAERRTFRAQRRCYRSSLYGWLDLWGDGASATAAELAHRLVPTLGTDEFFELY